MARVLICSTPISYSGYSRGSTPERNSKEPASGLPLSNASCSAMAGGCGPKDELTKAQRFISRYQRKEKTMNYAELEVLLIEDNPHHIPLTLTSLNTHN